MDILGVGPLELLFIFLIALIFLGPTDMVKAGRTLGKWMRKVVTSDAWREITRLRTLPNQLMREAGLEEEIKELKEIQKELPKGLVVDDPRSTSSYQPGSKPPVNKSKPDLSAWTTLHDEKAVLLSSPDDPQLPGQDGSEIPPQGKNEPVEQKPEGS